MSGRRPEAEPGEMLYGVNPVAEALECRPSFVERVYVSRESGARLGRLLRRAREAGVPVSRLPRPVLSRKLGGQAAVHQGVAARVLATPYADAEKLCREAARKPDGLLVLVDGVTDPGNLGAILRTSAAAGADGAILAAEGTAGLGPAVAKASAGAVERIAVARESRLVRRLGSLKQAGFLAVGLQTGGPRAWDAVGLRGRLAIVLGAEGRGLRPGLARACDIRVAIPLSGGVESLNVAVAAGVLLFETVRQRREASPGP